MTALGICPKGSPYSHIHLTLNIKCMRISPKTGKMKQRPVRREELEVPRSRYVEKMESPRLGPLHHHSHSHMNPRHTPTSHSKSNGKLQSLDSNPGSQYSPVSHRSVPPQELARMSVVRMDHRPTNRAQCPREPTPVLCL